MVPSHPVKRIKPSSPRLLFIIGQYKRQNLRSPHGAGYVFVSFDAQQPEKPLAAGDLDRNAQQVSPSKELDCPAGTTQESHLISTWLRQRQEILTTL